MKDAIARLLIPLVVVFVLGMQLWIGFPLSAGAAPGVEGGGRPANAGGGAGPLPSDEALQAVRRTMVDMRTIERALMAYLEDTNALPGGQAWTDIKELEAEFVPWYLTTLPKKDAWGWQFQYQRGKSDREYALRSRGSDGTLDPALDTPLSPLSGGDIVLKDHEFPKEAMMLERYEDAPDRQKQVVMDLRSIGTACEDYAIDNNFYPTVAKEVDVAAIAEMLSPTYIRTLPQADPWGHPFRYQSGAEGESYRIRSLGRDGRPGPEKLDPNSEDADSDIVFAQGQFLGPKLRLGWTMHAMTEIGMRCWAYANSHYAFPESANWTDAGSLLPYFARIERGDGERSETITTEDGWGTPLQYRSDPAGRGYLIRSLGSDRIASAPADAEPGDPRKDLVLHNDYLEDGDTYVFISRSDNAARLRNTMRRIREVDAACRHYQVDQRRYPVADTWMDVADLGSIINVRSPLFLFGDSWGRQIQYLSHADGSSYTIRSLGRDGVEDAIPIVGPTNDVDSDIVFSNGAFRSWPKRFPPESILQGDWLKR